MTESAYELSGVSLKKAGLLAAGLSEAYDSKNLNSFAGVVEHPYLTDFLFSMSIDGIGTKVMPLLERKMYSTIANDLAAMNLNDIICTGAVPIGFTDYISCHQIDVGALKQIIVALSKILSKYNCCLLSGETSETPKLLSKGLIDIAGCVSGLVKKDKILGKEKVESGDVVIGLCSSGVHSNGFSLLIEANNKGLLSESDFLQTLTPTRIYVDEVLALNERNLLNACAHITGGGLEENIKRVLPDGLSLDLDKTAIPKQDIFEQLEKFYGAEAWSVFNMGVGFCLVVNPSNMRNVLKLTEKYNSFILGKVVSC